MVLGGPTQMAFFLFFLLDLAEMCWFFLILRAGGEGTKLPPELKTNLKKCQHVKPNIFIFIFLFF